LLCFGDRRSPKHNRHQSYLFLKTERGFKELIIIAYIVGHFKTLEQNLNPMNTRRDFIKSSLTASAGLALTGASLAKGRKIMEDDVKVGVIGLDTSHSPAFAKAINDPERDATKGYRVVAAYPKGSSTIESSYERIPRYQKEYEDMGISIETSIKKLLKKVDVVLLETNDGQLHLEQATEVIEAKKPVFVDKPVAHDLRDTIKIYDLARKNNVPLFSSSSLRYFENAEKIRGRDGIEDVLGADTFGPMKIEPSHSDLYWYGIHGTEMLFTMLGTGCQSVRRVTIGDSELVIGEWENGVMGNFRGHLSGNAGYGGAIYHSKGTMPTGKYGGYTPLVEEIIKFFKTGKSPVSDQETLEIYAFMEAAMMSRKRDGAVVTLKEAMEEARG